MSALLAGLTTGALMASVFIAVGMFMAFVLIKDPPPSVAVYLARFPPGGLIMAVVVLSYPIWGIIGVVMGLALLALQNAAPAAGLGTPNLTYSFGALTAFPMLAAPIAYILRKVWQGVVGIALTAGVIFGWLLPAFAS
ncbi:MAG: hypothetical protein IIB17_02845 [Chloroflexi bacterium]|nr:hypothetical protein [Chloroflexota bacterium]